MRHRGDYEQELVTTVGSGTERWLTELRLAVVGIILSVALGAADIALSVSTWQVALVAGVGSTVVFAGILWRLRPRKQARRADLDGELRELGRGIAELRAVVEAESDPLRELLEAWAAMAEKLAEHADRIAEEAFIATESGDALRRLRAYDADVHRLAAEIRCLQAKA